MIRPSARSTIRFISLLTISAIGCAGNKPLGKKELLLCSSDVGDCGEQSKVKQPEDAKRNGSQPSHIMWCFENGATSDESHCEDTREHCEEAKQGRVAIYRFYRVPFDATACASFEGPVCHLYVKKDDPAQYRYYHCSKSSSSCDLDFQHLSRSKESRLPIQECTKQ